MTQHEEGVYELLNSKGEKVGTAYIEHAGPLSRWGWFAYVNGDTASASGHMKSLEETVKRYGFSVRPARHHD